MLYSTIVMVYFKQKIRTRKSNSYKAAKSRIESNIKVGIERWLIVSIIMWLSREEHM